MVRPHLQDLPPLSVPEGCRLRTFQPGDEEHWARIMNECIGEGWTAERCRDELISRPQFRADGCFITEVDGTPQGTATAWSRPELGPEVGYVHMVGVTRECRGQGLGLLVSLATLHWFRAHGRTSALLHTDDWRLAAIATYLRLGFEPVIHDEQGAGRWAAVRARLRRE